MHTFPVAVKSRCHTCAIGHHSLVPLYYLDIVECVIILDMSVMFTAMDVKQQIVNQILRGYNYGV